MRLFLSETNTLKPFYNCHVKETVVAVRKRVWKCENAFNIFSSSKENKASSTTDSHIRLKTFKLKRLL